MESVTLGNRPGLRVVDSAITKPILSHLYFSWNKYDKDQFPGPQPISIERQHFTTLSSERYWVCAKTDGVRFIMHFHTNQDICYCVLINRKNQIHILDVHVIKSAFLGTILDGELVLNNDTNQYDFLVYDAVCVCGANVTQLPHSERIKKCENVIMYTYISEKHNINMQLKTFALLSDIGEYNRNMVPRIPHTHDGLIFTPEDKPVITGTNHAMFKWKPKLKNTVDFWIEENFNSKNKYIVKLMKGRQFVRLHNHYIHVPNSIEHHLPGVFECAYNGKNNWYVLFKREDKAYPNNIFTMTKTQLNIEEDIRIEEFENLN